MLNDNEISQKTHEILNTVFTPALLNRNGGDMAQNDVVNLVRRLATSLQSGLGGSPVTAPDKAAMQALADLADYCQDLIRLRYFSDAIVRAHVADDKDEIGAITNRIERLNGFHQRFYHGSELPASEAPLGILAQVFEAAQEHRAHNVNVKLDSHELARTYRDATRQPGAYVPKGNNSRRNVNKDSMEQKISGGKHPHLGGSSRISRALGRHNS